MKKCPCLKKKNVYHLVEKYRRQFPNAERRYLRRLIRAENKIENPSELKKLDRYLAKAYKNREKLSEATRKNDISNSLRKEIVVLEEELGSEIVTPLLLRFESLNDLRQAGKSISLDEAEKFKDDLEADVDSIELELNEDDPHLLDKCNLLYAVKDHLRLAVDSLAKR